MPRLFTYAEADGLLPVIAESLRQALALRESFEQAEREFRDTTRRVLMLGGALVDQNRVLAQRQRRDGLAGRLRECIEEIEQHGCVVKDLELGLVDFPTRFRGREVCLCWKLGEARIGFWHGLEEGFRGRKPIDEEFILACGL